MGSSETALNFGAGPAKLPREVLIEVQDELLSYQDSGMGLMEMSPRRKEYQEINNSAQQIVRELLDVPDNYKIIFTPGGAAGAFAAVAMNFLNRTGTADYAVTGFWSARAAKEAEKYGNVNLVFPKADKPGSIPDQSTWTLNPHASYFYYCDNETVDGVEYHYIPETYGVPLVVDMSSNFMTRKVDVSKFGCIFGSAQKNIGPAGVVVVIVREDLLGSPMKICPSVLDYNQIVTKNSVFNTPATFSVYVMEKVLQWIKQNGGLDNMEQQSERKSGLFYDAINNSNGFYSCSVDKNCQSRVNIPFRAGGPQGDEALEALFLVETEKRFISQLKGHSAVGGLRVSLYIAITYEEVALLVKFMEEFQAQHQK